MGGGGKWSVTPMKRGGVGSGKSFSHAEGVVGWGQKTFWGRVSAEA